MEQKQKPRCHECGRQSRVEESNEPGRQQMKSANADTHANHEQHNKPPFGIKKSQRMIFVAHFSNSPGVLTVQPFKYKEKKQAENNHRSG